MYLITFFTSDDKDWTLDIVFQDYHIAKSHLIDNNYIYDDSRWFTKVITDGWHPAYKALITKVTVI